MELFDGSRTVAARDCEEREEIPEVLNRRTRFPDSGHILHNFRGVQQFPRPVECPSCWRKIKFCNLVVLWLRSLYSSRRLVCRLTTLL